MSNFSYINAIPLPILDITNTGKTIRDFDVDIATRIKQWDLILQGESSFYYNSNPETDTIGSNWPVGMSFEELCYFFWKVEYFNWGGTSTTCEDGSVISFEGNYSPTFYPRFSKKLNENCVDYLQKGDLYYAIRIINHFGTTRKCSFYNFPENDYSPFIFGPLEREFYFANSPPSPDFGICFPDYSGLTSENTAIITLTAFWHPFAYLNDPARGGSGNPMDIFNFFPRIIKNDNLYYPSMFFGDSILSCSLIQLQVRSFALLIKNPVKVQCESGEETVTIDGLEEEFVSETKLIDFKILNTTRKLFVFSASQRILADCEFYPLETVNATLGNISGMTAHEEQPN